MPLAAGDRLGPYEILSRIGVGGMGEVWRARDTRLSREVAIKISANQFSDRFEAEARAVAALNHPNICHLYDVGPDYLVMEYIDGKPLEGPLPFAKALDYAAQILDALDAAHRKGITHRDLKPANILVTGQGIKLLDFGLAKQSAPLQETDVTRALTQSGQIVGTLAYMSPEQLHGKDTDARSDIFSFGLVFYEMLAGRKAFDGESAASVIAGILERDPPSLGDVAPAAIDRVLRRSLAKAPDQRWQSARDLKAALELASQSQPPTALRAGPALLPWAITALAVTAFVVALWAPWQKPVDDRMMQLSIDAPTGAELIAGSGGGSAISPDGSTVALVAAAGVPRIWLRPLDSLAARELPETDGATNPFWSPDGRALGFFADGKLKRIDVASGLVEVLGHVAPTNWGGTWNEDGTILFSSGSTSGLLRIPASGGSAIPVTTQDAARSEGSHRWPQFLPGGRQFLYFIQSSDPKVMGVYIGSLESSGGKRRVVATPAGARYVRPLGKHPGYLLWLRQSTPTVQPFEPGRGVYGEPVTLPGANAFAFVNANNDPRLTVSNDGTVLLGSGRDPGRLAWLSREGNVMSTVDPPDPSGQYNAVQLSPDGKQAAVSIADLGAYDIWTIDFARHVKTRVTSGGRGLNLIWSHDGSRIVHYAVSGTSLMMTSASGAGEDEVIVQSSRPVFAGDWSPDGRYLIYEEVNQDNHYNLSLLPMTSSGERDRSPVPYLRSSSNQSNPHFSPDGKWVAYSSDESGRLQVYVNSFPVAGTRWQVSNAGGNFPRWSREGNQLYYRAQDGNLMSAGVRKTPLGLEFRTPVSLFRTIEPAGPHIYQYDVAANGDILALVAATEHAAPLTVILNWQSKLK